MNRRWEWIILSVISLIVFEENIVVTVLAKLVPLFFKCSWACFFLTRSLIDRCQIVTDTCKNDVSKFVWKPFKSPLSLRKWKCFAEASLFNLHHLYFNYHLLTQKLFCLWKILPYLQPQIIQVFSERISLSWKNTLLITYVFSRFSWILDSEKCQ